MCRLVGHVSENDLSLPHARACGMREHLQKSELRACGRSFHRSQFPEVRFHSARHYRGAPAREIGCYKSVSSCSSILSRSRLSVVQPAVSRHRHCARCAEALSEPGSYMPRVMAVAGPQYVVLCPGKGENMKLTQP